MIPDSSAPCARTFRLSHVFPIVPTFSGSVDFALLSPETNEWTQQGRSPWKISRSNHESKPIVDWHSTGPYSQLHLEEFWVARCPGSAEFLVVWGCTFCSVSTRDQCPSEFLVFWGCAEFLLPQVAIAIVLWKCACTSCRSWLSLGSVGCDPTRHCKCLILVIWPKCAAWTKVHTWNCLTDGEITSPWSGHGVNLSMSSRNWTYGVLTNLAQLTKQSSRKGSRVRILSNWLS